MLPVAGEYSNVFPQLHSQPLCLTDLLLHESFESNFPIVPVGPSPQSLKGTLQNEPEFQSLWLVTRRKWNSSSCSSTFHSKLPASSLVISEGWVACLVHVWMLGLFSRIQLCEAPWTVAHQAPLSMGFSRQEYWSGLPCPPPGDFPNPGIKLASLMSLALARGFFSTDTTQEAPVLDDECSNVSTTM